MTPDELNHALAVEVMQATKPFDYICCSDDAQECGCRGEMGTVWYKFPDGKSMHELEWNPVEDDNHMRLVRDRLVEMDLMDAFIAALAKMVLEEVDHFFNEWEAWELVHAKPDIQAQAALEVVRESRKN